MHDGQEVHAGSLISAEVSGRLEPKPFAKLAVASERQQQANDPGTGVILFPPPSASSPHAKDQRAKSSGHEPALKPKSKAAAVPRVYATRDASRSYSSRGGLRHYGDVISTPDFARPSEQDTRAAISGWGGGRFGPTPYSSGS